jgi:hypothetical protein
MGHSIRDCNGNSYFSHPTPSSTKLPISSQDLLAMGILRGSEISGEIRFEMIE